MYFCRYASTDIISENLSRVGLSIVRRVLCLCGIGLILCRVINELGLSVAWKVFILNPSQGSIMQSLNNWWMRVKGGSPGLNLQWKLIVSSNDTIFSSV